MLLLEAAVAEIHYLAILARNSNSTDFKVATTMSACNARQSCANSFPGPMSVAKRGVLALTSNELKMRTSGILLRRNI